MNKHIEDPLYEKYPVLFSGRSLPITQSLMAFGCECRDGWAHILDHLFGFLTEHMNRKLWVPYSEKYKAAHANEKLYGLKINPPQIILDQVKEKFGTLRVYYHTAFAEGESPFENPNIAEKVDSEALEKALKDYYQKIDNAIDYAEYQTSRTCEVTGQEGKLYTKGWHSVLCDEEAKKQNLIP
jgi:hypothetical protein